MSRCFPYPPPGYVRNPGAVAVAEVETTTKLQKEREKADRKKEKRNEKKALQQGGGETSKHSKRSHKKRKLEDSSIVGLESRDASKDQVEQLEKSGLTEEHGAPFFTQTSHGSPESSQDSSKRRKVILPSPSQSKNGSILRIKIRRDQDSPAAMLDNSRVLEQPPAQQMGRGSSLVKQNSNQPPNIKGLETVATLTRSIKRDSQAVVKQGSAQPPADVSQRVHLPTTAKVMQKIDPRLSVNSAMRRPDPPAAKVMGSADPSTAKLTRKVVPPPEKVAQRVDLPPAKVFQKVDNSLPSKVLRKDAPPSTVKVLQKEADGINFCQASGRQPSLLQKSNCQASGQQPSLVQKSNCQARGQQPPPLQKSNCQASGQQPSLLQKSNVPVEMTLMKQQQQTDSLPQKEEPCFSGRNTGAAAVPEVKPSKPDRKKNRKAEKKEKKFGDLFVTWNPPSFEMEDAGDLGAQDWLLGGARKPDASMSDCAASDRLVLSEAIEQQFLLQPRANYLPDLHIYQLPYVVPF